MKTKKNYLKYIAVALVVVFVVTAALMFIEVWESREGKFPETSVDEDVVFNGKQYKLKDGIETFLVLGLDKFDGQTTADSHESGVQADFLMLFVFDNTSEQLTAVHINRDTMTQVNKLGVGGARIDTFTKQIALSYNYVADDNDKVRCGNTKTSVQALFHGVKVDHYLSLTMDSVPALNDLVGGVEVEVLDDFTGIDDALVKGQTVRLMGEQALRYVRTRYGLEDSSNSTRMVRQQQYIEALHKQFTECVSADDGFIIRAVDTMDDYLVYDSSDQKMQKFAEKFDSYEFLGVRQIEGETKIGEQFAEFYPDEQALRQLVIDLFYTEK